MNTVFSCVFTLMCLVGHLASSPVTFAEVATNKTSSDTIANSGMDNRTIAVNMTTNSELLGKQPNNSVTLNTFNTDTKELSPSRSVIKVMGALLVVLVVIVGVAKAAKKLGVMRFQNSKQIIVRESINIGTREKLILVDFSGESLLLGVTTSQVNILKSVPQLRYDSSDLPAPHLGARNALDFQQKLNEFLIKGQK